MRRGCFAMRKTSQIRAHTIRKAFTHNIASCTQCLYACMHLGGRWRAAARADRRRPDGMRAISSSMPALSLLSCDERACLTRPTSRRCRTLTMPLNFAFNSTQRGCRRCRVCLRSNSDQYFAPLRRNDREGIGGRTRYPGDDLNLGRRENLKRE